MKKKEARECQGKSGVHKSINAQACEWKERKEGNFPPFVILCEGSSRERYILRCITKSCRLSFVWEILLQRRVLGSSTEILAR